MQEYDVADLVTELGDLEFAEKSNDLYKFRQSADLAASTKGMPRVRAFRELMRTQVNTQGSPLTVSHVTVTQYKVIWLH